MKSRSRRNRYWPAGLLAAWMGLIATGGFAATEHEVTLFSIDYCPSCEAAKAHMQERDITYHEFNIQDSDRARAAFERLDGRGIPLLFLNGETLNGFHPQRFDAFWEEATGTPVPEPSALEEAP